jgi:hypothetical protein
VVISAADPAQPYAVAVSTSEDILTVDLSDGGTISAPIVWYPRLAHGTPEERGNWLPVGGGEGIHWPDLDEDISIDELLVGRRSGESQPSLNRWPKNRAGQS